CTMSIVVQAAWAYLLHRYTGQQTVLFGAVHSGRHPEVHGIEGMVGLFMNTIPVLVSFRSVTCIGELLAGLLTRQAESEEAGYLSLREIQDCSSVPRGTALFNSL